MRSMRRITEPVRAAVARSGRQDSTGAGALASNDFDASPGVERRIATGSLPRSQPGGRGERLAVPLATRTHGVGTGPPPPRAPSRPGRKAPCAKENCQQVRTISSRCLVASMTRSCEWWHPDLRAFTLPSHPHVLRATEFSHASCVNSGCALPCSARCRSAIPRRPALPACTTGLPSQKEKPLLRPHHTSNRRRYTAALAITTAGTLLAAGFQTGVTSAAPATPVTRRSSPLPGPVRPRRNCLPPSTPR